VNSLDITNLDYFRKLEPKILVRVKARTLACQLITRLDHNSQVSGAIRSHVHTSTTELACFYVCTSQLQNQDMMKWRGDVWASFREGSTMKTLDLWYEYFRVKALCLMIEDVPKPRIAWFEMWFHHRLLFSSCHRDKLHACIKVLTLSFMKPNDCF
jgi:hypothetical protein